MAVKQEADDCDAKGTGTGCRDDDDEGHFQAFIRAMAAEEYKRAIERANLFREMTKQARELSGPESEGGISVGDFTVSDAVGNDDNVKEDQSTSEAGSEVNLEKQVGKAAKWPSEGPVRQPIRCIEEDKRSYVDSSINPQHSGLQAQFHTLSNARKVDCKERGEHPSNCKGKVAWSHGVVNYSMVPWAHGHVHGHDKTQFVVTDIRSGKAHAWNTAISSTYLSGYPPGSAWREGSPAVPRHGESRTRKANSKSAAKWNRTAPNQDTAQEGIKSSDWSSYRRRDYTPSMRIVNKTQPAQLQQFGRPSISDMLKVSHLNEGWPLKGAEKSRSGACRVGELK